MDLGLTRRGDYVVRLAIALARADGGGWRKVRHLAEEMEVPVSYAPQILGHLVQAGLVQAKAGPGGGYRLARRAGEITMLDVVEAGEGPLGSRRCIMRGGPCRWNDMCAAHPAWARATEALRSALADTTLAVVAAVDAGLERSAGQAAMAT